MTHESNLRFGGTYLDLDVITQTSLDNIPEQNFVCAQSPKLSRADSLANGIISLDVNTTGRHIAELFLKYTYMIKVKCFIFN